MWGKRTSTQKGVHTEHALLSAQSNSQQLDKVVEIGTNLQSNAQVASLYRAIFKLMLANSEVDPAKIDRNVER